MLTRQPALRGLNQKSSAPFELSDDSITLPVFHAGAGPHCYWDDGGFPPGFSAEYITIDKKGLDIKSFGVKIHGNSMLPSMENGDIAIIDATKPLQHGKACYVTDKQDDLGERLIRRYFNYNGVIVLKPDNPQEGFEITITPENEERYGIFRVVRVERLNP
jgi:phage repressor protein C with HTH and peptisase S24 domain